MQDSTSPFEHFLRMAPFIILFILIQKAHQQMRYRTWTFFLADRSGYVLEHRFTKFSEISQCNGHYAVQWLRFWYLLKAYIRLPISDQY